MFKLLFPVSSNKENWGGGGGQHFKQTLKTSMEQQ